MVSASDSLQAAIDLEQREADRLRVQAEQDRAALDSIAPHGKLNCATARDLFGKAFRAERMTAAGWKLVQGVGGSWWERGS